MVSLIHAQILPLSFVFHELATNAAEYGNLFMPEGRVEIARNMATRDGRSQPRLNWVESGPSVPPPERSGFESRLIAFSVTNDLDGRVEQARINVPLT